MKTLYDYKGSLVVIDSSIIDEVGIIATDYNLLEGSGGTFPISSVPMEELKPVDKKDLPLYISKLHKSRKFFELFR